MSLKHLDYGRTNPFREIIGRPRYLAWPVDAYRVTFPRQGKDHHALNPFERVILKLLEVTGIAGAKAVSEATCIPLDLVKGILLRLQDKGLIDEYGHVTEQGRENNEAPEETPIFVTALVYRELATGKVLPFLHVLDDANPLRKKEGDETTSYTIRWDNAKRNNSLAARDVISALRIMKRRLAGSSGNERLPSVQQITIAGSPEVFFLECPIAIQKSDGEFRIGDPFGNGFSLILERAFECLLNRDDALSGWLQKWKQTLRNAGLRKAADSDRRLLEPYANEVNRQRYPKLVSNLRPSQNEQFRSIAKIYASIEWALFYACSCRQFQDVVARLRLTEQSEHHALLDTAAQGIGMVVEDHIFNPVRQGKLLDFDNGQAELGTVLAISILQAQMDESHPLRRIVDMHPNVIGRLYSIKKKRDGASHGKGGGGAPETELSDDPFMREFVHALLPEISFADTPVVSSADRDARADALLDARASIQNEFGFRVFNRLGTNLQSRLTHAERFWLSCNESGDDARAFADDLYAALQSMFEKWLAGKLPPDVTETEFIGMAGKKLADAALGDALPLCLRTVKASAIRQTMQGVGQTLGACAIAVLLMSDADTLRSIADVQPSFIADLAHIITARGHGNEPLPLPRAEIEKLRKASYTTIKTLNEI